MSCPFSEFIYTGTTLYINYVVKADKQNQISSVILIALLSFAGFLYIRSL